jgi:fluoride exporter
MSVYLAIAIGGSAGAVSRFWMSNAVYQWLGYNFPYGTLAVNLLGSLLMGFLSVLLLQRLEISEEVRLGVTTGFLGSFTTFSTFALDSLQWINSGAYMKVILYIGLSVTFCLFGAWLGLVTGKQIFLR